MEVSFYFPPSIYISFIIKYHFIENWSDSIETNKVHNKILFVCGVRNVNVRYPAENFVSVSL